MEFEVLKDLAKTITRNKIKNIEVLGNPRQKKNRVESFYEGIISDKFETEQEAVRHFFKSHDKNNPSYLKLKSKLIHQLVNTSLFVDVNQPIFNERAKAYFTAYKDFAAASILMVRNTRKSGIYLFQLILEQAIKYEFIELAADTSRLLRRYSARITSDNEKNQQYTVLNRKYEEKRRYETLSLDYYETLVSYYVSKRAPNEEIHRHASAFFDELLPLVEKVDTSSFYNNTYNIGIIKYMAINDTENALQLCELALEILKLRKNTNRGDLTMLVLQKMACYTQLRNPDYIAVEEMLNYCLSINEEDNFNWFRVYEVYFYYCTYSGKFEEALSVYSKVAQSPSFSFLEGSFHDNWLLMGGYLHLLAKLGALDPSKVEEVAGPFRYGKIYNEIEVLKKDKEGMNIPLILLPVLFQLSQKPEDRTKEIPIEALEKYRQRWMANNMNRRSSSFVKLLIAYSQKEYDCASAEKKIKKELEILKRETPEVAGQNFTIEVIPYETLWELLNAKR